MSDDITIPPEALEAAAFHLPGYHSRDLWPHVETAILAALNAWPGATVNGGTPVWVGVPHMILPLTEKTND